MNPYLRGLNKLEFVVTYACTGQCKHCSEGDHTTCGERMDPHVAANAVRQICAHYPIQTVMTFGGEPLLYPEAVFAIHSAARDAMVPRRQVITNGYFSCDTLQIRRVAQGLMECGVNDLLLSADAFHQETIPLDTVRRFAVEIQKCGISMRIQPAWLVTPTHDNPYNCITREILDVFCKMGIEANDGNTVFWEGNATKYLSAFFEGTPPQNPYVEDPQDIRCLSFDPDGGVLRQNVYQKNILEILKEYQP